MKSKTKLIFRGGCNAQYLTGEDHEPIGKLTEYASTIVASQGKRLTKFSVQSVVIEVYEIESDL